MEIQQLTDQMQQLELDSRQPIQIITTQLQNLDINDVQLDLEPVNQLLKQIYNEPEFENTASMQKYYKTNVSPFIKNQDLINYLDIVLKDPTTDNQTIKKVYVLIGSFILDESATLKTLDRINALPHIVNQCIHSNDVQLLIQGFWVLSNYASIKKYSNKIMLLQLLLQRASVLYRPCFQSPHTQLQIDTYHQHIQTYMRLIVQISWFICNLMISLSVSAFKLFIQEYPTLIYIPYNASKCTIYGVEQEPQSFTVQDIQLQECALHIFKKFAKVVQYPAD